MKESIKIKLFVMIITIILLSACISSCNKSKTIQPEEINNVQQAPCNQYEACFEGIYVCGTNSLTAGNDTTPIGSKIKYVFLGYNHTFNSFGQLNNDSLLYQQQYVDMNLNVLDTNSRRNLRFRLGQHLPNLGLETKTGKAITFYREY